VPSILAFSASRADPRGSGDPYPSSIDRLTLAAFAILVVLAGGNAVGIKVVGEELDPLWGAAVRFGAAGLIFVVLMVVRHAPLPRGGALFGSVLYGILGFGAAFGLAFIAIPMIGAGTGQLLLGLVPLLTLVLAPIHRLERFRLRATVGSLIALGGVAILAADRISLDVPIGGIALGVGAAILLAEAGIVVKLTPRANPIATNAVGMLVGAALLLPISWLVGERWSLPTQQDTWAAMIYLVVAGSVIVFWLFVFVLGRWSASAASFEFLLIPLATIPFSALLTHEVVTPIMLLGGALILAGVYFGAVARHRELT
jgi:drug/metabolite transporter (DMT)-like permease